MNIKSVNGISAVQRSSLNALGAVETDILKATNPH
jgi:hypothetical protein